MTEKEAWSKIRVINYLLQNIDDAMGERDVKTSIKYCLMGIQEEGFIPSFELIENGDLLRIDIPGMFFLEFDPNRKATAIRTVYHFGDGHAEVRMDAGRMPENRRCKLNGEK